MLPIQRLYKCLIVSSFGLAVILFFDLIPFLRGDEIFNWQWFHDSAPFLRIIGFAIVVTIYLAVTCWLNRHNKPARWILLWSIIGTVTISLVVIWLRHDQPLTELFYRTISPTTTGPHMAGALIDWESTDWYDWRQVMLEYRELSIHVALSPPGLPMLYEAVNSIFESVPSLTNRLHQNFLYLQCNNFTLLQYTPAEWASAIIGVLMPLWAGLSVLPLYAIAKRWLDDSAKWIASLWALIPALVMFGGSWNTAYPLLALLAFWCLVKGMETSHAFLWLIVSGFITGILTFANFSIVPLVGLLGFYVLLNTLLIERQQEISPHWSRPIIVGSVYGIGLALPWLIYGIFSGLTPLDLLQVAFEKHLELDRPYIPWLWFHFWEWVVLTGIPLTCLWLVGAFCTRQIQSVLPLALLLTILILLFSNTARGETGRVWLFFSPFMLLSAGLVLHHFKSQLTQFHWHWLLIAQASLMITLASTWVVISAPDIHPRPETPPIAENLRTHKAVFNSEFQLLGWEATQRDEFIQLDFHWQAQQRMTTPYFFAATLVAPDNNVIGEPIVWQPQATRYPTTCWQLHKPTGDVISIPLPEDAEEGNYWVSLAVFEDEDNPMMTLDVILADRAVERQLGLGPIPIKIQ